MTMPKLPENLTVDILSRLPVKTLSRFKSISKDFLTYLSDDHFFHQLHRLRSQKYPFVLSVTFSTEKEPLATVHISSSDHRGQPINQFAKKIEIESRPVADLLPSHHHLVCIASRNNIYICNPSTEELLPLPPSSVLRKFCPAVGFGYLPSKKEYKVLKLSYLQVDLDDPNNWVIEAEILTIATPTNNLCEVYFSLWRVLEERCPYVVEGPSVFVNGFVHWKIHKNPGWVQIRGGDERILSFNLEEEKFQTLPPPLSVTGYDSEFELAGIRGNLWLVEYTHESFVMELWVLKDWENPLWKRECRIDCRTIGKDIGARMMHPLDFQNAEEILFRVDEFGLIRYNVKNKTYSDLREEKSSFRFCYYTDGFLPF
ncbi:hypothetical protein SLE2022_082210 [Rubroshorea leprosula]